MIQTLNVEQDGDRQRELEKASWAIAARQQRQEAVLELMCTGCHEESEPGRASQLPRPALLSLLVP